MENCIGNKIKRCERVCIFIVGIIIISSILQCVLIPKWVEPWDLDNHSLRFNTFNNFDDDNLQAVFIGTSHVGFGIIPLEIYKNNKIVTYNLANDGMTTDEFIYFVKHAAVTAHPEVIIIDIGMLFDNHVYAPAWERGIIACFKGMNKVSAGVAFSKSMQNSSFHLKDICSPYLLSVLFPFYKYHNRWDELDINDFYGISKSDYNSFGYSLHTSIIPGETTIDVH